MAATLIHIKSKMLLPRPETAAGVEGEAGGSARRAGAPAARAPEVQGGRRAAARARAAARGAVAAARRPRRRASPATTYEPELEVDLFSLMTAFQAVRAARQASGRRCCCRPSRCRSKLRIEQLLARLSETEACGFEELFADVARSRRPDRHVPGAARDDSVEAGEGLPVGHASARSASTSARGRPTRRIRLATRRHIVADEEARRPRQVGRSGKQPRRGPRARRQRSCASEAG